MFDSKEDSLVTEDELLELLGIGRGALKKMWQTGLGFVQIRDSKGTRFYLASDIIAWAKFQVRIPDASPIERVNKPGSHTYKKVSPPEECKPEEEAIGGDKNE